MAVEDDEVVASGMDDSVEDLGHVSDAAGRLATAWDVEDDMAKRKIGTARAGAAGGCLPSLKRGRLT